jgi:hypothetical protein
MATVMKASEFVKILKDVATNYKTLYVMGCYGAPMTKSNKKYYCTNHEYNMKPARTNMINAASSDTFGFDCVCLIKGVLWGWNGDTTANRGGAKYKANGVKDVSADGMIALCKDVTTNFSHIEVGEAVWCKGHIGVYIGDGLTVECTPAWKNKVQITAVKNMGVKSGYKARQWTKHGKLPYVDYDVTDAPVKVPTTTKASDTKMKKITKGSKGKAVKVWQAILGIEIDGSFGPKTKEATLAFQKKAFPNDKNEWDGVVGEKTWKAGLESVK